MAIVKEHLTEFSQCLSEFKAFQQLKLELKRDFGI
jgi:hypothetical protein